jgi:hypothetical protein
MRLERRALWRRVARVTPEAIAKWARAKAKKTRQVLQNGAKCTGGRRLRTRTGGWRSGRDAGSLVGNTVAGFACSDCAVWVVAAPLLVSRGGGTRAESKCTD